jgi:hypothetical protein
MVLMMTMFMMFSVIYGTSDDVPLGSNLAPIYEYRVSVVRGLAVIMPGFHRSGSRWLYVCREYRSCFSHGDSFFYTLLSTKYESLF